MVGACCAGTRGHGSPGAHGTARNACVWVGYLSVALVSEQQAHGNEPGPGASAVCGLWAAAAV